MSDDIAVFYVLRTQQSWLFKLALLKYVRVQKAKPTITATAHTHTTKKVNIKWRNMKLSEWLALVSVIVFNIATEEISHTHTNIEFWMWIWNDNIMPKIDNVCCLYIFAADACEWHWTVCVYVYVCLCVCSASHCCLCEKNTHWFKWIEIIFHSFEICRGKEKPH